MKEEYELERKQKRVLVITSCIEPNENVLAVKIKDPEIRKVECLETLNWAITNTIVDEIILVDTNQFDFFNKGKSFLELKEQSNIPVKLLSFRANQEEVVHRGKGYGEGEAIKYALQESKGYDVYNTMLIKITGGLEILNINEIMENAPQDCITINLNYPYHDMYDTRFYMIPFHLYEEYLVNCHKQVDDRKWICLEHLFYRSIINGRLKTRCTFTYPLYMGKSRSTGKDYSDNPLYKRLDVLCKCGLMNNGGIIRVFRKIDRIKARN